MIPYTAHWKWHCPPCTSPPLKSHPTLQPMAVHCRINEDYEPPPQTREDARTQWHLDPPLVNLHNKSVSDILYLMLRGQSQNTYIMQYTYHWSHVTKSPHVAVSFSIPL